jgi:DNA-binding CsgD family transcriptional regulator
MPGVEEHALALYQALRAGGGGDVREIGATAGLDEEQAERGWRRLDELGLLQYEEGAVEAVEPDMALVRTMDAYHANAAEQVLKATSLQRVTQALMTVYRPAVAYETSKVELEYLRDRRSKNGALAMLNATSQVSADSLHPGPMPPMRVLAESLQRDAEIIARGVRVRAMYPQALLQIPKYVRYLTDLSELGAEVRLIDHAPFDLLIQDRETACIPGDPDDPGESSMILVHSAALVRSIAAIYDDYWLRALPFETGSSGTAGADGETELTAQERVVIRLMAGGLSDDQVARKMGVHRRTVQRAVAKLMERLQAGSRFEAGLKLAQDSEFARALRPGPARPPVPAEPGESSVPSVPSR